jgi:hypothetical protein
LGESCGGEVDFIASHINEMPRAALTSLPVAQLGSVLESESLVVESEDDLCTFVFEATEDRSECFGLFEFVRFEFLSGATASKFAELAGANLSRLNSHIWSAMSRRFGLSVPPPFLTARNARELTIAAGAEEEGKLRGIFHFLRTETNNDIGRYVTAESRSINGSISPDNALDGRDDTFFQSQASTDEWLRLDLQGLAVRPSSYTLGTYAYDKRYNHLKSWDFEGLDDSGQWVKLDIRKDTAVLNGKSLRANFAIAIAGGARVWRSFRVRMTGPNHIGCLYLTICHLEIFGDLIALGVRDGSDSIAKS